MAEFENSGDLILNSTLYPDGTVAALEELIGCHGGLGGEQTDAYLFHPGDMQVPATRNSYEFKAILDSRRGLPGPTPIPERAAVPKVNPWAPATLGTGLSQIGKWLGYAVGAVTLKRDVYREIARDAYMTGPALLIALIAQALQSLNEQGVSMLWTSWCASGCGLWRFCSYTWQPTFVAKTLHYHPTGSGLRPECPYPGAVGVPAGDWAAGAFCPCCWPSLECGLVPPPLMS
jgi:hypothetical protein